MSVNSKMTAIADKIRSLLGSTSKMGLDAMATNLSTLQSQIAAALTTIADKGVSVPSGAVAGNLSALIALLPDKFTNMLRKAVESDGTTPYNGGLGYKENYYMNGITTEATSTNYDITGFIPIMPGDVVRLKNVQVCKLVGSNTKCQIHYYDSSRARVGNTNYLKSPSELSSAWAVVTNAAGDDIVQFTFPTSLSSSRYIRMTCGEITSKSIITINEEIT